MTSPTGTPDRRRLWERLLQSAPDLHVADVEACARAFLEHGRFGDGALFLAGVHRLTNFAGSTQLVGLFVRLTALTRSNGSKAVSARQKWLREFVSRKVAEKQPKDASLFRLSQLFELDRALASGPLPVEKWIEFVVPKVGRMAEGARDDDWIASDVLALVPRAARLRGGSRDLMRAMLRYTAGRQGLAAELAPIVDRLWQEAKEPIALKSASAKEG